MSVFTLPDGSAPASLLLPTYTPHAACPLNQASCNSTAFSSPSNAMPCQLLTKLQGTTVLLQAQELDHSGTGTASRRSMLRYVQHIMHAVSCCLHHTSWRHRIERGAGTACCITDSTARGAMCYCTTAWHTHMACPCRLPAMHSSAGQSTTCASVDANACFQMLIDCDSCDRIQRS